MSPNAPGEFSVSLARPRGTRTVAVLVGLVALALWAVVVALVAENGQDAVRESDWAIALAIAVVALAGLTLLAGGCLRLAFGRRARLVVSEERLWLEAPALLRGRASWRRADVVRVALDAGAGTRRADRARFPVVAAPAFAAQAADWDRGIGHLFTRADGGCFPVLALRSRVPNLVVIFAGARPGLRLRPMARLLSRRTDSPRLDRPADGLLLEVDDCDRARETLAGWMVDGPIVADAHPDVAPATAPGEVAMEGTAEPPSVALALALVAGAYLIPLLLAGALMGLAVVEWSTGRLSIAGVALALLGLAILVTVIPRGRAEPVGPEITRERQPLLFGLIDEAASSLGVEPFDRVIADLRPVAETTAVGLLGRRRVLTLGLPLAAMLTRQELLALVARELGRSEGPHRRVSAVTLAALDGLERTVRALRDDWFTAIPARILGWYAGIVERRVPALRRRRELAADAAAAHVAGPAAVAGMLRAATCVERTYPQYWERHVGPVLGAGRRPPIVDGLRRFLARPWIRHHLAGVLADEARHMTGPSWSHPSLGDRLSALGRPGPPHAAGRRAGMLDDDDLERAALATIADPARVGPLARISWSQVGEDVLLPLIRASATRMADTLDDVPVESLAEPWEVAGLLRLDASSGVDDAAIEMLGGALCVALADAGWATAAEPGEEIMQSLGEERLWPFAEVAELLGGRPDARERWGDRCESLGITGLPLGGPPARHPGSAP